MKTRRSELRYVLADVNVWLATLVADHPHHELAEGWWRDEVVPGDLAVAFCRLTQLGTLRLLTNPSVMGERRRSVAEAWSIYQRLLSRRRVVFAPEPAGTEALLAEDCTGDLASPGFWTDAYLAAFARAADFDFVTFDRGFSRYSELRLNLLG